MIYFYFKQKSANILLFAFLCSMLVSYHAQAQKPTSFSYPTPVVYTANVSNVYLSPAVSGLVDKYSMPASPALPAGLLFDVNTGVISGKPTAALSATTYTITATNSTGTAQTTINMTVLSNYLNNNNAQVSFGGTGVDISHPNGTSTGQTAGDITLYQNVSLIGNQAIDCYITTKSVNNVSSWDSYDQPLTSAANFSSNDPKFFAPQVIFGTGGGSISYDFQFIFHGTYNSITKTGTKAVLQNVTLNSYDIDGNGNTGSNQFNEFGGFNTSQLGASPTVAASYNAVTGLTKFRSTSTTNSSVVTAPATRVQVTYTNLSDFSIVVGAEAANAAYFFLDFAFRDFAGTNITSSPSIDLDTNAPGVANESAGCGTVLAFTPTGQTNITSTSVLNELDISYPMSDIKNAAGEVITINGASSGTSAYPLNFTTASTGTVVLGAVTYNFAKTVTDGINTIAFTRTTGGTTFTVAQAEALLDAMQYTNTAATPTAGERKFTVNVLNGTFKSPDAVFYATVNCVSLSGHIYHDANGLLGTSDANTVNATAGTTQFAANFAYAILVNPTTNKIIASKGIDLGGAFSFGTITPGTYIVYVSKTAQTAGANFTAATYPDGGYVSIGENLGASPGNDLLIDGKLTVTVGSTPVTDANFGLQIPPVANNVSASSQSNPGGTQTVVVPTLNGTDTEDGTLQGGTGNSVKITSLPTNAKLYYNGVAVDLASPVISNYDPTKLKVDPDNGALTVVFKYKEVDAAGFESPEASVTMPFTEISISGKVYHDINGVTNSLIDGTLISNPDGSSPLYANLVDHLTGLVLGTVPVSGGSYAFNTFSGLKTNSNLDIVISTVQGSTNSTTGATMTMPTSWASTAEGSANGDGKPDGLLAVNVGVGSITTGLDFGIEKLPTAGNGHNAAINPGGLVNVSVPANTFTNTLVSSDPDGTVKSIRITSFPSNSSSITIGSTTYTASVPTDVTALLALIILTDDKGNPTPAIAVHPANATVTTTSIPFVTIDNAGKQSANTGQAVLTFSPLPVTLISFDAVKVETTAKIEWSTSQEINSAYFDVMQSEDAKSWKTLARVNAYGDTKVKQVYSFTDQTPSSGVNYYRLKMVDNDGTFSYSRIKDLNFDGGLKLAVFPNPVSDFVKVLDIEKYAVNQISIIGVNGSVMYQTNTMPSDGISVKSFEAGYYFVRITEKSGAVHMLKLVVSR